MDSVISFPRTGSRGAAHGVQTASNQRGERLDPALPYREDRVQRPMKNLRICAFCLCFAASLVAARPRAAQDAASPAPAAQSAQLSRVTVGVSGGVKDAPVEKDRV